MLPDPILPQSGTLRHGDDVVFLLNWTALDHINDLPLKKRLAAFMHPWHFCSNLQIGSRLDAGIAAVAPES
jgi:hypothetical protein